VEGRVVANDDGPSTRPCGSASTRELAQRLSGADEVLLLWHPERHRVELCVRDRVTGAGFRVDIAPVNAMDAFHHPYAYRGARRDG
jgi:hypothetical protein